MNHFSLMKSPFSMIMAVVMIFMLLNAFLPLGPSFQTEVTEYPFRLTTILEKTRLKHREAVNVTLSLMNIREENITLYHSRDLFDFEVYDADFLHVYHHLGYHSFPAIIYPFKPIAPSSNFTWTLTWTQIYDGESNVRSELRLENVPPGTYYITGFFRSFTYDVSLQTPPMKIKIGE